MVSAEPETFRGGIGLDHPARVQLAAGAAALAALGLLVLLLHLPLVLGDSVLTDYDLFAYFYPYWEQRAAAFRAGEFPLWDPYIFAGAPFLANPQAGVLYPLNWPLSWLSAPRAVAVSYLFHLWLAGAGCYFLMRRNAGCGHIASLLSGVVFSLGGVFAAQAGHINQVQAAAWLPWLALAVLERGRWWLGAGVCFYALGFLAGHPQQTFMTSVGLGLVAAWACAVRLFESRSRVALLPLARLRAITALGLGLAAAQLLPSLELSGESIRAAGLGYRAAVSFSLPPPEIIRAFLPTFADQPVSEYIGYVGIAALLFAALGLWAGRPGRLTLLFALLLIVGAMLAFGRFNPLYHWLFDHVPGFGLFRAPSRWLLLYAFGVAGLAGLGLDAALRERWVHPVRGLVPLAAATLFSAAVVLAYKYAGDVTLPPKQTATWWLATALVTTIIVFLSRARTGSGLLATALLGVVAAELFWARAPLPVSRPSPPAAYTSIRPGLAQLLQDDETARSLGVADPGYAPGDLPDLSASLPLSPAALQDLVASTKYMEILSPNIGLRFGLASLDGYDGGLLPLKRYAALKERLLRTAGVPAPEREEDGEGEELVPIRDRAMQVPDSVLLGKLNVKYITSDRLWDVWHQGVYHDLGAPATLQPHDRLTLEGQAWPEATLVSVVSYLEDGQNVPQGAPVARMTLTQANGVTLSWVLAAGVATAESNRARLATAAHQAIPSAGDRRKDSASGVYAARVESSVPLAIQRIEIEALLAQGSFTLAGLALVDGRTGESFSPPMDTRLKRVYTGDVKVYQNLAVQPRLEIAHEVQIVPEDEGQIEAFVQRPAGTVVLPAPVPAPSGSEPPAAADGLMVATFGRDRVEAAVSLTAPGYLVFTDAFYPGWRAFVDAREVEVLRADYMFKAVPVPAGTHRVVFVFEPGSLQAGLIVSGISLVLLGGLVAVWGRRAA